MARRKYQFKDRAEAEEQYRKADRGRLYQLRLARALYTGRIEWVYKGKSYRFGIFDRKTPCGPKVVVVFTPPTGQEPDLTVYDPDSNALTEMEQAALRYPREDETRQIVDGVQAVRSKL